ncbi:caveolin-2-like [Lytechinus variegatus]|uniref:caveolin-2-like n=1 Tax=Lytechinus variegatus TaxID=7654 RepID=UPI001BB289A1|nr:caveolin-2-like [Lytechinus variegatus]
MAHQVHPAEIAPAGPSLPRESQHVQQEHGPGMSPQTRLPPLQQVQEPASQQAEIPLQPLQTLGSQQQLPNDSGEAEADTMIYNFPAHVSTGFTETFKESEDIKGLACMEKCNGIIYKYTHLACYGFLTIFFTPFIAFFWALFFASVSHLIVWFVQPFFKAFYITFRLCHMVYRPIVRQCLEPLSKRGVKTQLTMPEMKMTTGNV